jgi:regulatory protein
MMKKQMTVQSALRTLTTLCAGREVCSSDVREKLRKWALPAADAETVMAYLIKERYVDDTRYAAAFVKDKIHYNKWGKLKVVQGLRLKRIPPSIIVDALDAVDDETYQNLMDDVLRKKWASLPADNDYERRTKLFAFGLRRGMEGDVIRRFLSDMGETCDDLNTDASIDMEGEEDA